MPWQQALTAKLQVRLLMVFCSTTTLQKQDKSDAQEMGHDAVTVITLWGPGVRWSALDLLTNFGLI